jgi:hypothetical protein
MQFGKISGLALIILGILLCGLQGVQYMSPQRSPVAPDQQSTTRPEHKTSSLPGIIGTGSLVIGIVLLLSARRKDEPEPRHAVK